MPAIIAPCSCKHEFQDAKYGNGQRVFNQCKKVGEKRCTVCGKKG